MIFGYMSPDTLLPMTSVLAAAVGVAAMFGRGTLSFIARRVRGLVRVSQGLAWKMGMNSQFSGTRTLGKDQRQARWRGPIARGSLARRGGGSSAQSVNSHRH